MKITNADVIKSGERELIDTIIGDLDWETIEQIVKSRHKLKIQDDVEYRQGDIVVHDNQVAYKLDFDVKMTLSVMFDRNGNYLSLITSEDAEDDEVASEMPPDVAEAAPEDMKTAPVEDDTASGQETSPEFSSEDTPAADPDKKPTENFSKMASHIAEMISDINDD